MTKVNTEATSPNGRPRPTSGWRPWVVGWRPWVRECVPEALCIRCAIHHVSGSGMHGSRYTPDGFTIFSLTMRHLFEERCAHEPPNVIRLPPNFHRQGMHNLLQKSRCD
jgi:hypothetical protein